MNVETARLPSGTLPSKTLLATCVLCRKEEEARSSEHQASMASGPILQKSAAASALPVLNTDTPNSSKITGVMLVNLLSLLFSFLLFFLLFM